MTSFKQLFQIKTHHRELASPSVTVTSRRGHTFQISFDSKDIILEAGYRGTIDPWLESLCALLPGKNLHQASSLDHALWEKAYQQDDSYWEFRSEAERNVFFYPLDLLKSALDMYRGRDYLYKPSSHLLCRCFGVREDDVLAFLKSEAEPTLEKLSAATKAGMGCRTCVPQLKRWLAINSTESRKRFYKDKSYADWLLIIDDLLSHFPLARDWDMSVESFKGQQVIISYDKEVSQKEEESVAGKLQGFLASGTDAGLGFFLRRSRQRSNALG